MKSVTKVHALAWSLQMGTWYLSILLHFQVGIKLSILAWVLLSAFLAYVQYLYYSNVAASFHVVIFQVLYELLPAWKVSDQSDIFPNPRMSRCLISRYFLCCFSSNSHFWQIKVETDVQSSPGAEAFAAELSDFVALLLVIAALVWCPSC